MSNNMDDMDNLYESGESGLGHIWIKLDIEIPGDEQQELYNYLYNCSKKIPILNGMKKLLFPNDLCYGFSLPLTEYWLNILLSDISDNESIINDIINNNDRRFSFCTSKEYLNISSYKPIVGINTYLKYISIDEANEIKKCINRYELIHNNTNNDNDTFHYFMDPISLRLYINPVIASDGCTYSKSSLESIIFSNKISPLTRENLIPINNDSYFIPNIQMRQLLNKYIDGKLKIDK
jgi:hypothetical protein